MYVTYKYIYEKIEYDYTAGLNHNGCSLRGEIRLHTQF